MKLFLAALTIWSLPFFGISCGSPGVQNQEQESTSKTVTLTNQKPTGSFPVQRDVLKAPPTTPEVPPVMRMVIVPVTQVVNPNARAVTIFVYLSRPNKKRNEPAQKIEVGNFSLYPADRPGKFSLNVAPALRKAAEASNGSNLNDWQLVCELEQKPEQGTAPLEVTIAAPIWAWTKG